MFTFNPSKYDDLDTYKRINKKQYWRSTTPVLFAILFLLVVFIGISLILGWTISHTFVLLFLILLVIGQFGKKNPSNYRADTKDESQGICTVDETGIHYKSEIQTYFLGWHSIQAIRRKKGLITVSSRAFLNQPAHNFYWFSEILSKQGIDIDALHTFILRHLYEKAPAFNAKRLMIKPLSFEELGQLLNGSEGERVGQFSLTSTLVAEAPREIIEDKQRKTSSSTDWRWRWHTYFLVGETKKNRALGLIGFKGEPVDGTAEFEQAVGEIRRNTKQMVASLNGLLGWAAKTGRCKRVVTSTNRKNAQMQKVLRKCGFFQTGESGEMIYYQRILTRK